MRARSPILLLVALAGGFALGRGTLRGASEPALLDSELAARAAGPGEAAAQAAAAASGPATATQARREPPLAGLTDDELRQIEVFRNAKASVVHIANLATRQNLFTLDVLRIQQGTGSGFVWDRLGHVVTNFHVIEGGDTFVVRFADQSEREAKVVGVAPDKDLAVLKIDAAAASLVPLAPGRSSELQVGQKVLALGNPFGLDHSLTVGVVSALDREIQAPNGRRISEVIQTHAAINPGNSGGPLLDSAGRLIGVNSAIFSPSGASAGIGFAIPVDTVTRLVPQLIRSGRPIRAGIGIVPLSDSYARRLGIEGVVLREVTPGGPADRAGLVGLQRVRFGGIRLGDVIVGVDGKPVRSLNDLLDAFERAGVGQSVELRVQRDDGERNVRVKLIGLE